MPHISVSDSERVKLIEVLAKGKALDIPFRSWELHEWSLVPQTDKDSRSIKTSVDKPQYIFFGFQTNRKNQITKDYSQFDHCDLSNIKVYLNDDIYPYDNLNLNFGKNQIALLYDMYAEFQLSFFGKESEPLFTPTEFKNFAPIVVIDCTKQNETLKRGPISIRVEFETRSNIPAKTSAWCLILHDRLAKYIPAQNIVRLV